MNNRNYYPPFEQNYYQQPYNGNGMYSPRFQSFQQQNYQQNQQQSNYGAAYYTQNQNQGNQRNFSQNNRHQRFWPRPQQIHNQKPNFNQNYKKKRPHDQVDTSSPAPSTSRGGETSPAPKRYLQKQNSVEAPKMPMLAPATPQQMQKLQKKSNENVPAKNAKAFKENDWNERFTETLKMLDENFQPGEEVSIILKGLQPPRIVWSSVKDQIFSDMKNMMDPLGVSKILVFGSTLTGLDFVGSDLDYHVSLTYPPFNSEEVKQVISRTIKLARSSMNFLVVFSVMHARVPIVRLIHKPTNVFLDVNFTSPFGFYNSQFIGTVLSFDNRIKDLAVILKLWSKATKISERMVMSNYCLVMLLIFYLQNLQQPMLDSVKNNQSCGRTNILDNKYRWNFFFNDKINKSKQNTQSTRQLLEGFFEFYDKINYQKYILCVYSGDLIERSEFDEHQDTTFYREVVWGSELPPLKHDNPETFIVQDCFEQNLNIGIKSKKHCETFFDAIKASHVKCDELKNEPFSTLLVKLFSELKFEREIEKKTTAKGKKKFQMTIHSIAGDLKLCQDILVHNDSAKVCSIQDQQNYFFNHVYEGTKRFLTEIYLCNVVESSEDIAKKQFKIILDVDTVNGRKKHNFKDDASVAAEIKISNMMKEKKIPLDLDADVTVTTKDGGKTVDIEMIDSVPRKKSGLPNFGTYFAVNITPALKYYLKTAWDATQL